MASNDIGMILGCTIEHDASGVGHAWRIVAEGALSPDVHEAIAGEIQAAIDDGRDLDGGAVVGGEHYRWSRQ